MVFLLALLFIFDVVEVEEGGVAEIAVLCVRCCSDTLALPPCHLDVPDDLGPSVGSISWALLALA